MTYGRRRMLMGVASLVTAGAMALALAPGSAIAAGHGGRKGGGGGETTVANNLSVPAVFVDQAGFGLVNAALQEPTGEPSSGYQVPGEYFVQGVNHWQAQFEVLPAGMATATAAWGDNLTGSASLAAGHPIRVEMALTDDQAVMSGYTVVKLDTTVADRLSPYGTKAIPGTDGTYTAEITPMPARVWVAGATLSVTDPAGATATFPMPGEINATGAVVFGYNWRPSEPGGYTLAFHVPAGTVNITNSTTLAVTVKSGSGGGGGRGGGGGGRGRH